VLCNRTLPHAAAEALAQASEAYSKHVEAWEIKVSRIGSITNLQIHKSPLCLGDLAVEKKSELPC